MASMQAETNQKIAALTDRFNQQIAALQGENRALLLAMQPFMASGHDQGSRRCSCLKFPDISRFSLTFPFFKYTTIHILGDQD